MPKEVLFLKLVATRPFPVFLAVAKDEHVLAGDAALFAFFAVMEGALVVINAAIMAIPDQNVTTQPIKRGGITTMKVKTMDLSKIQIGIALTQQWIVPSMKTNSIRRLLLVFPSVKS